MLRAACDTADLPCGPVPYGESMAVDRDARGRRWMVWLFIVVIVAVAAAVAWLVTRGDGADAAPLAWELTGVLSRG